MLKIKVKDLEQLTTSFIPFQYDSKRVEQAIDFLDKIKANNKKKKKEEVYLVSMYELALFVLYLEKSLTDLNVLASEGGIPSISFKILEEQVKEIIKQTKKFNNAENIIQ